MSMFGPLVVTWMLLLCLVQVAMLLKYIRTLRTAEHPKHDDSEYPPAMAVLCLRGTDPFLKDCIDRLLAADYPRLNVRIVVDSAEDPAAAVVQAILAEKNDPRAEVMILKHRLPHCSGKVSGLLCATENLPPDCEMVAWIDGDSLLHSSALKELADGLRDPSVGAVSGNRWYLPPDASLSGLTRMLWNGFAVPAMNMVGILWGGCMAISARDFQNPKLRDLLANSFIEDSTICSYVRATGRRTSLVASAILLNRESISLSNYYRFATRQLFTVRVDNSRWWLVALHMLSLNLTLLLGLILVPMPWLPWWWEMFVAYNALGILSMTAIPIGHLSVRRTLTARGENVPRITFAQWLMLPIVTWIPNQLNLISTLNTFFIRQLTWRGITYRFNRKPKCTIVKVQSMDTVQKETVHSVI